MEIEPNTEVNGSMLQIEDGGLSAPLLKLEGLESVTIVGMGPTGSMVVPHVMRGDIPQDEKNPIWVINHMCRAITHDLAWNTHDINKLAEVQKEENRDFKQIYTKYNRPVVTFAPVPGLKTLIYPIKEVVEYWQDTYFFAAPSYMLAYAGWCKVPLIRMFGMDFDYPNRTEYEAGRCCTEYWIGRLKTLGTKFQFPKETTLMDYHWAEQGGRMPGFGWPLYGFFDKQPRIDFDDSGKMMVTP